MESWAPWVGYVAGSLTVVSFLPQVLKAWRTKRVNDLSMGMFVLLIVGGVLWLVYGFLARDWPIIITNAAMITLIAAILVAKLKFGSR